MDMDRLKIAVIGGGNMGAAIAAGVVRRGVASAANVVVSHPKCGLEVMLEGIPCTRDNREAVTGADIIIMCVKPWIMERVVAEVRDLIDPTCQTVVSVVAGVDLATLSRWFDNGGGSVPPLFRAVPNTAVSVGRSMTFMTGCGVSADRVDAVRSIFGAVGEVRIVEEDVIPAVTALASCGMAYILKYIDAAVSGGEELGLDRSTAMHAVVKTVEGALAVLEAGGCEPREEIDRVTTPGGITLKGLARMEECGFSRAVAEGLKASL